MPLNTDIFFVISRRFKNNVIKSIEECIIREIFSDLNRPLVCSWANPDDIYSPDYWINVFGLLWELANVQILFDIDRNENTFFEFELSNTIRNFEHRHFCYLNLGVAPATVTDPIRIIIHDQGHLYRPRSLNFLIRRSHPDLLRQGFQELFLVQYEGTIDDRFLTNLRSTVDKALHCVKILNDYTAKLEESGTATYNLLDFYFDKRRFSAIEAYLDVQTFTTLRRHCLRFLSDKWSMQSLYDDISLNYSLYANETEKQYFDAFRRDAAARNELRVRYSKIMHSLILLSASLSRSASLSPERPSLKDAAIYFRIGDILKVSSIARNNSEVLDKLIDQLNRYDHDKKLSLLDCIGLLRAYVVRVRYGFPF